ncbi:transmembrane protein, putative (macronuclear) [Tetrahymena thermophila SB210]|uniref:Transmembrane protein, putative n=1 Tax=Tetrahymena thermophila (strain SB210) TaxID=312017 RepID=W7XG54_TETTS|nr:transmembrane protein, putative [Tetrahymena thermophila SB210]EWS75893.1 transmembrane protein, putative [Tetrahymena thermophila SB210]|eukprot:XP_012651564.1 transmembrane protein, putative [Tetrahymena thermophila SB210]
MIRIKDIVKIVIILLTIIASTLQNDNCNQEIVENLITQGFQVTCDSQSNIIADCNHKDMNDIQLNLTNLNLRGGIQFVNINNIQFSLIQIQDTYMSNQSNSMGLFCIDNGNIITIQNFIIKYTKLSYSGQTQMIQIKNINILTIQNYSITENSETNATFNFLILDIQDQIKISQLNVNVQTKLGSVDLGIKSTNSIAIDNLNLIQQNQVIQFLFSSQNIQIGQFDIKVISNTLSYVGSAVNIFQDYKSINIKTINIIQVKDLQLSLFQFCSTYQSKDATQFNNISIDSIVVQNFSRGKQKTSIQSIENDYAVGKPVLFDLSCTGISNAYKQNLNIQRIDVYQYNIQNALFMVSFSSINTVINQIVFHQQDQKVFNLWNSNGMFVFQGSSQTNSQLEINNIDFSQINFVSAQNGLISVSQFSSLSISNVNVSSSEHLQSYQGGLFTINNVDNVKISNIVATIYPSCQFKSMFGGLIYIKTSQNTEITNLSFNDQNQFSDEVQHQGTQGGIIYIYTDNQSYLALQEVKAQGEFISTADGAFAYISCINALLEDIFISEFTSLKNGGAFFLDCQVILTNVQLIRNKSQFAGGAIFGGLIASAQDVIIKENQSLFGGGIYLANMLSYYQDIKFESNLGYIKGDDTCKYIAEIKIKQFSEYNQYLEPPYQIRNYTLLYQDDGESYIVNSVYNGLTYFVVFSMRIQDESDWIEYTQNDFVLENRLNDLTPQIQGEDIFNQAPIQSIQTIPLETNEFFYSFSFQYDSSQTQFFGLFFPFNTTQQPKTLIFTILSNITSNCTNGMIQQTFKGSQYCQYCVDSVVYQNQSKKIPTKCLSCPKDYFESCYADFSSLKQGFWRQNLTVDSSQIFPCSINRFNCIGGNYTGDNICAEGHIGVECSECDLYDQMGNGSFCRKNIYQCTQCDEISGNIIKSIILLVIVFIVILIIFKTNFRQQRNYIYKKYLSDMKIIYLGKSYYRLGQSGSYIKILSFYFQIINISSYFYGEKSWANIFNFQYGFYNPVADSAFSFDCFLAKINESTDSIMYKKITIVTIAPFCIVFICLIPSVLNMLFCKSSIKNFQYSASLIISYGFTNLFCIPVIDVLTSGMLCRTFNNGQSYSILDFNIECNDTDRLVFLFSFVIPFILVYSVVIPGILFYILYKNRENLDKISFRFLLGFLYADFKQQFYYWEYLRFILKLILIMTVYSFLSFTQLIGFVSLAALILYLIFLVRKYPYCTKKLNEMEVKSIVIGSLFLIAQMTNFSLYEQDLAQKQKNQSMNSYNVFSQVLIVCTNILSLLFIAYMVGQICISILQPHLYKLQDYRCYKFIQKYLRVLRFKKYTERKRKNIKKLQMVFKIIIQNSINDIQMQCFVSSKSQSCFKESESILQQEKQQQKDNDDQLLYQYTQKQNSQESNSDLNKLIQIEEQQQNYELLQKQDIQL